MIWSRTSAALLAFGTRLFFDVGSCSARCRSCSSIPAPHTLDAGSTSPNLVSRHCQMYPRRQKSSSVEDYWSVIISLSSLTTSPLKQKPLNIDYLVVPSHLKPFCLPPFLFFHKTTAAPLSLYLHTGFHSHLLHTMTCPSTIRGLVCLISPSGAKHAHFLFFPKRNKQTQTLSLLP